MNAPTKMPRAVAWKVGRSFTTWHVRVDGGRTACGIDLTALPKTQAVSVAALRDVRGQACKPCVVATKASLA